VSPYHSQSNTAPSESCQPGVSVQELDVGGEATGLVAVGGEAVGAVVEVSQNPGFSLPTSLQMVLLIHVHSLETLE
jgi:hypothetical protein